MIAKVETSDPVLVEQEVTELISLLKVHDNMALVRKMKAIVPEFKSQNSVYAALDVGK